MVEPSMVEPGARDTRSPLTEPTTTADDKTTLTDFLDYYRVVFRRKVEGIDDAQSRIRVAPSDMDLLGMTRHLADVERWWFRFVFTGEVDALVYETDDDPDADWHPGPTDRLASALDHFDAEVTRARTIITAAPTLDAIGAFVTGRRGEISLRWIIVHMIEEYARHCGHADYLRQAIDGVTGD